MTSNTTAMAARNVLFIMCDQLRPDYLSCYGGAVHTPNIDRLAAKGVRFDRAYVTSGVCGPSRTSYYTGRYPISHRVTWNRVPLPIDELTLGDYLGDAGMPLHLLGKTHFVPDTRGRNRHFEVQEGRKRFLDEGGFTPVERYDGHFELAPDSPYRQYLLEHGYRSEKPWTDFVIGSDGPDGETADGWYMRNAPLPARVEARHSETAYLTSRAIDFIERQGSKPWALHLSYIKPHWPYKAPAPYNDMYSAADAPRPVRSARERDNPHPVFGAYQQLEESVAFAQDHVVDAIRPVYMGLVKQIDDEVGRLLDRMEQLGTLENTLVIFTSDHGDLGGDHWLGEKEYFYEPVMKVPLIVRDPDRAANGTRGTSTDRLVECIDIVPSILEFLELPAQAHRVEGRSLIGLLRGDAPSQWRTSVFGHLDYAYREARTFLGRGPLECNGFMVRNDRYKYIWWQGYRSQLFDLQEDPQELRDRGTDASLEGVRRAMQDELLGWLASSRRRATESSQQVVDRTHAHERMMGILIGRW